MEREKIIRYEFKDKFSKKIEFPEEIPVLNTGKRKVVINEYKKA